MQFKRKLLASALAGCLGALVFSAGIARAATTTTLPINGFYQVVTDTAHGHLFFSQGSTDDDDIVVTNLSGQEVTAIGGQDGVMGIALSRDGSTLYAALASGHAVSAISTSTLKVTATYPLPAGDTPQDVAVQSGKVWVSYGNGTAGEAAIGDISLSAAKPAFETQSAMGGWYTAPQLAADPRNTGALVAALPGISPATVASYGVAAGRVTVRAQSTAFNNCDNETDLAVTPGGADFILACGWPYNHYEYSTANLSQQGEYASTSYPDAVAIAANGTVAAGVFESVDAPDLYIYRPGASSPLATYQFEEADGPYGELSPDIAPRGLAWSADSTKLYVVLQAGVGTDAPYTLSVVGV